MLSFVLSKAGALTAAAVLGLGGLGAYALTSVPDSQAPAATNPKVRTEVIHRTRHVQGPPREVGGNEQAVAPAAAPVPSPAPAAAPAVPVATPPADEAEEIEADDEGGMELEGVDDD